jgi:hypothetical protein
MVMVLPIYKSRRGDPAWSPAFRILSVFQGVHMGAPLRICVVAIALFAFIGCGEEEEIYVLPQPDDDGDVGGTDSDIVFETERMACGYEICTDKTTGLMWQRHTPDQLYWSKDIPAVCKDALTGGFAHWRLPTIDELRTLIRGCPATMPGGACAVSDPDCREAGCAASCKGCGDNAGPDEGGFYWEPFVWGGISWDIPVMIWSSSEVSPAAPDGPVALPDYGPTRWAVHFATGAVYLNEGSDALWVRCVRDTLPTNDDDTLPDSDTVNSGGGLLACSHEGLNNCLNNWVVKCKNGQYAFMKDCGEQECKVHLGDPGCVDRVPDDDTLTADEDELVPDLSAEDDLKADEDVFYDDVLADE